MLWDVRHSPFHWSAGIPGASSGLLNLAEGIFFFHLPLCRKKMPCSIPLRELTAGCSHSLTGAPVEDRGCCSPKSAANPIILMPPDRWPTCCHSHWNLVRLTVCGRAESCSKPASLALFCGCPTVGRICPFSLLLRQRMFFSRRKVCFLS